MDLWVSSIHRVNGDRDRDGWIYEFPVYIGLMETETEMDEMQHNAAFHLGLHCLIRQTEPSGTEKISQFRKFYT